MSRKALVELSVAAAILLGVAAAVILPPRIEARRAEARRREIPTVELTGLMTQGVWTDERVVAANAWRRDFRAARPVLEAGKTVRLRLGSADVVHGFAVPALGIAPVEVYPGRPVDILVTPREAGTFEYYCTTVCGDPHFAMRGFFEVVPEGSGSRALPPARPGTGYWRAAAPAAGADAVTRGSWVFERQGCVTCHGEEGRGGVPNPNSMNETVLELAGLARRTYLFTKPDVAALRAAVASDPLLRNPQAGAAVPLFPIVKRQYLATRELVRGGRRASPLDPAGPRPPLDMPAWGARLTDADIDAVLAYLLTLGDDEAAAPAVAADTHSRQGDTP